MVCGRESQQQCAGHRLRWDTGLCVSFSQDGVQYGRYTRWYHGRFQVMPYVNVLNVLSGVFQVCWWSSRSCVIGRFGFVVEWIMVGHYSCLRVWRVWLQEAGVVWSEPVLVLVLCVGCSWLVGDSTGLWWQMLCVLTWCWWTCRLTGW